MKYLIATVFGAITFLGLSSCGKNKCYTCEHSIIPCTIDICDDKYSTGDNCGGITLPNSNGLNNDQLKDNIENIGFTCKAK